MNTRKVTAYAMIAALVGVFGLSAWLASAGRFLEAIALVGVVTTLGWFLARILNQSDKSSDS